MTMPSPRMFSYDCARTRLRFDEVVTLIVGHEKRRYVLHKSVLADFSHYFKTLFSGDWLEVHSGIVKLCDGPPVDGEDPLRSDIFHPEVFDHYVWWLYTGKIEISDMHNDMEFLLIRAYVLGDRLQSTQFRNAIINVFATAWRVFKYETPCTIINAAMASQFLPATEKLRDVMVYKYATHIHAGLTRDFGHDAEERQIQRDLLVDILQTVPLVQDDIAMSRATYRQPLDFTKVCELFHQHISDDKICTEEEMRSTWICVDGNQRQAEGKHPFMRWTNTIPVCELEE